LEESRDRFGSWEEASQAGKKALERKRWKESTKALKKLINQINDD
jgi:hypothetical protein